MHLNVDLYIYIVAIHRKLSKIFQILIINKINIKVLFLISENEISGIVCNLFRGRQNIFLTIFSTKFVVKCVTKNLKIG